MKHENLTKDLCRPSDNKILFLIMDGLGGLPDPVTRKTELESAETPNMDKMALEGCSGRGSIVAGGITPGSGPGHLALFGYNPLENQIGRGVLEALGVGFDLRPSDLAARGNFCTIDSDGVVTDRRAGLPTNERNKEVCALLNREVHIPGVEVFVLPGKQHRFAVVFRGEGLTGGAGYLTETDPQQTGLKALKVEALRQEAGRAADVLNEWLAQARKVLAHQGAINFALLRGMDNPPAIQPFTERYCLKAAAIATYPMYKGIARMLGMDVIEAGSTLDDEVAALTKVYDGYDFFYFHVKETDSAGHAGDFAKKVQAIEKVDEVIPVVRALGFQTVVITGDHSTPTLLKEHSFHPVPVLLWSTTCLPDMAATFGERECMSGGLGTFPMSNLMEIALGHAMRLDKYGA